MFESGNPATGCETAGTSPEGLEVAREFRARPRGIASAFHLTLPAARSLGQGSCPRWRFDFAPV